MVTVTVAVAVAVAVAAEKAAGGNNTRYHPSQTTTNTHTQYTISRSPAPLPPLTWHAIAENSHFRPRIATSWNPIAPPLSLFCAGGLRAISGRGDWIFPYKASQWTGSRAANVDRNAAGCATKRARMLARKMPPPPLVLALSSSSPRCPLPLFGFASTMTAVKTTEWIPPASVSSDNSPNLTRPYSSAVALVIPPKLTGPTLLLIAMELIVSTRADTITRGMYPGAPPRVASLSPSGSPRPPERSKWSGAGGSGACSRIHGFPNWSNSCSVALGKSTGAAEDAVGGVLVMARPEISATERAHLVDGRTWSGRRKRRG